ncbi:sigma-70 family RNA polymerase sigma factor [Prosthecomicrobium pneumaticum]|nr:sigma-70 family RNA polymerase sigma factor [Prosthecomicrobium pneumaticum]
MIRGATARSDADGQRLRYRHPAETRRSAPDAVRPARGEALAQSDESRNRAAIEADHALMQEVAAGDRGAFARLMAIEAPRLTRFAAATLTDLAEAEEVVQEALVRLWQQAEAWQPNARLATWLHQVAYRLCIDRLRRRRPQIDIDGLDDTLEDDAPRADQEMIRADDVRRVRAALARLPDRQRIAIVLSHFQELPQAEAASVMAIGEHAYESLLARARRRVRQIIEQEEAAEGEAFEKGARG